MPRLEYPAGRLYLLGCRSSWGGDDLLNSLNMLACNLPISNCNIRIYKIICQCVCTVAYQNVSKQKTIRSSYDHPANLHIRIQPQFSNLDSVPTYSFKLSIVCIVWLADIKNARRKVQFHALQYIAINPIFYQLKH